MAQGRPKVVSFVAARLRFEGLAGKRVPCVCSVGRRNTLVGAVGAVAAGAADGKETSYRTAVEVTRYRLLT